MRRIGGLAERTASHENVMLAVKAASKSRNKKNALVESMRAFKTDLASNVAEVMTILRTGEWRIDGYRTFQRREHGKVRKIDWNPSFRDSVIQHALFQTVGRALNAVLIPDTFSGIEGRGMHYGMRRIRQRILSKYPSGTPLYVFKGDVRHYYESIDTKLLKQMLRAKIKDAVILRLLYALIDSHPNGLPIGNYQSQMLANFYLNEIDHWAVELGIDLYRYCDDIVALGSDKSALHEFAYKLNHRLHEIHLELKPTWQVFPIERTNGIDFMGFTITRDGVRLRKRIERNFRRSASSYVEEPTHHNMQSLMSYNGWTCHLTRGEILWNSVAGELAA